VTVPAKLRYEVRRLFEDTSSTMLSPNRKAGAINPRALHKFGQSDNLFQLRRDIDGIDSAVVICVDVSSSMFDTPQFISNAVTTALALCETLDSAGVKTAIVTFGCEVSLAAGFDERLAIKRDALSRLRDGGSTNDFAAIRHSHDLLRVRPEQRKVCFVLTDGDGNVEAARRQAEGGEVLGITTVGVGICHGVSHVYPKAVRVDDPADLARVALGQIKLAA
jgi:nitric oxide reductase activation protein